MTEDLSKEIAERLEKLKDLEVLSNDHSNVISGLISLEYIMKTFITDFESDISVSQFVYGMAVTRTDYAVRHVILRSERLPATFDGYRILHFSDLHVASLVRPKREVADIVDICNAHIFLFHNEGNDGRVDSAATRAHNNAFKRSKAHRGVDNLAVVDCGDGRAVS